MFDLAKPEDKLFIIKNEDFSEFIKTFNKNKESDDLLESCRKVGGTVQKSHEHE